MTFDVTTTRCRLPWWLSGKESACNAADSGDAGLIPGLGRPLEEGMATCSSILAWRIPWTEEPGELPSTGSQKIGHEATSTHVHCALLKLRWWLAFLSNEVSFN